MACQDHKSACVHVHYTRDIRGTVQYSLLNEGSLCVHNPFFFLLIRISKIPFVLFYSFRFKEGTFRLNVLLNSKINIICPHNAISLAETDDSQPSYGRYENFWIVDNSSYHSCNVNTSIKSNEILFRCNDPALLLYETLVFKSFHADKDLEFAQGKTYYFICKY